jgi:membrane-associated protein
MGHGGMSRWVDNAPGTLGGAPDGNRTGVLVGELPLREEPAPHRPERPLREQLAPDRPERPLHRNTPAWRGTPSGEGRPARQRRPRGRREARRSPSPTVLCVPSPVRPDASLRDPAAAEAERERSSARTSSFPWEGRLERADRIIVAGLAASAIVPLLLLPLVPALVASHPALLELLRGSTASIINMGARARTGETSFVLAVLLGVPSLMMFDWVFWWAGRRWGDRVFEWLLGGPSRRTEQRLSRLHRIEARVGPFAVVFAYLLPIPAPLIYAAVGDGGMRLGVFLVLDAIGTLLWTSLLAAAGYGLGQRAVDVADTVSHYGLWVAAALFVVAFFGVRRRAR